MVGELASSSNGSVIHKISCMKIIEISQWDWTFMSSRVIRRDVEQLPMDINVLGCLFHHLQIISASNLMPLNPMYEL